MLSSATNIRSSWSDLFHRSLCLRRKLESRYNEQLCLPLLQRSRDRMSAVHTGQKKESGIEGATRGFNDTNVPPSSMLHPNLLISGRDKTYAFDFDPDDNTTTSLLEYDITEGFSDDPGYSSPALSPSFGDVTTIPDSLTLDLSALESVQTSDEALTAGVAQPMLPLAPESVPLAAPAAVHNTSQISTQKQLPTTACGLTRSYTPAPADTLGADSFVLAASDVVTDAAPETATNATAVSCELLRG
ncbi:hypothetical protein N0V85_005244 [Neurospora sp. IMI 360204]|nr:hypothetical protein N0V85_005244 [Neurospora sp. IMI 360204]